MPCLPAVCSMSWDDGVLQGRERMDRQLLDAGALVGHLVPAGSMFAFLAAHRQELFGDEDFADFFPSGKGRPSVPASVMASGMVLRVLHDYSDAEAAEAIPCGGRRQTATPRRTGHRPTVRHVELPLAGPAARKLRDDGAAFQGNLYIVSEAFAETGHEDEDVFTALTTRAIIDRGCRAASNTGRRAGTSSTTSPAWYTSGPMPPGHARTSRLRRPHSADEARMACSPGWGVSVSPAASYPILGADWEPRFAARCGQTQ